MKIQVLGLFIVLALLGCEQEKKQDTSLLRFLPEKAAVVIKINNLSQFKSDLKNNAFISSMDDWETYKGMESTLKALRFVQADTSGILAFRSGSAKNTDFVFAIPKVPGLLDLEEVKDKSVETEVFQNTTLLRYTVEGATFFSGEWQGHVVISSSREQVTRVINGQEVPNIDPTFQTMYNTANPDRSGSIFINTLYFGDMEDRILKEGTGVHFANYAEWISLDMESNQDNLRFYGMSLARDTVKSFIGLFRKTNPLESATPAIAPSTADAILAFSINNYDQFAQNQKRYLELPFVKESTFLTVEEIGHIFFKDRKAIVLHTYGAEEITQYLQDHKIVSTEYQGYEIVSLNQNDFLNNFFDPLISDFNASFYTVIGNAFVFGPDRSTVQTVISHYNRDDTFAKSAIYGTAKEALADEANILFIANSPGFEEMLGQNFTAQIRSDFKIAQSSDLSFGAQVVADENFYHTNIVVREIEGISRRNTVAPLFTVELDGDLATDPQFVLNHRTRTKEIVVQDDDNNLYLISGEGKVLWKKKLEGRIQGKISQVDLYKNGRLQLAFTTGNQFLILDRNGREVKPFNKTYPGGNLNALAVFDYENNKNYRFVVSQGTKLFMYNAKGDIVKGFTFTSADSPVLSAPKHFRIGRKDYLVLTLENGALKILSRTGKPRIQVKERFDYSENDVLVYKDKFTISDKSGTLFAIDQKGGITGSKLNLQEDHGTDATSNTLVIMNDNVLSIKGKKISLDLGVYTKPRIFYINDKIYVSVTDLQSQKTYLFDSNAESISNFPVLGISTPDVADIDNDRKLELVTRESDRSLIVYKMN